LWAALRFLTCIPLPDGVGREREAFREAFAASVPWFPVVGLLIGSVLVVADLVLRPVFPPLVESALVVVLLLTLTGALHADGLMDTADAVLVHATPERRLEIMRDPRVGAFGVVAFASVLLLKLVAVDALPPAERGTALLLAPTVGRWAIVLVATVFPYGRPSGLGAPLKVAANWRTLAVATLFTAAVALAAERSGIVLVLLPGVWAWALGRWLMGKLPGLTGDCYGAVCEVVETTVLLLTPPLASALR
jgi:adenosylcobinamide-GDP ribazoletransferase